MWSERGLFDCEVFFYQKHSIKDSDEMKCLVKAKFIQKEIDPKCALSKMTLFNDSTAISSNQISNRKLYMTSDQSPLLPNVEDALRRLTFCSALVTSRMNHWADIIARVA